MQAREVVIQGRLPVSADFLIECTRLCFIVIRSRKNMTVHCLGLPLTPPALTSLACLSLTYFIGSFFPFVYFVICYCKVYVLILEHGKCSGLSKKGTVVSSAFEQLGTTCGAIQYSLRGKTCWRKCVTRGSLKRTDSWFSARACY